MLKKVLDVGGFKHSVGSVRRLVGDPLERLRGLLGSDPKLREEAPRFDVVPAGEAPQSCNRKDPMSRGVDEYAAFVFAPI